MLESISTCDNKITKIVMYFTINLAFTNYLDMLPNLTGSLPIIQDRMRYEQPLPLNLSIPYFDNSLRHRPTKLKDFTKNNINNDKENFDLQQRHTIESLTSSNKNFFFKSHCKYFHVHFFYNFNSNNNTSCLLILQTQTYQNNNNKLNIA